MSTVEFETTLDNEGKIQLPANLFDQFQRGERLQVSIKRAKEDAKNPDEIWEEMVARIKARMLRATPPTGEPYQWNRDEIYDHLDKYGRDEEDSAS